MTTTAQTAQTRTDARSTTNRAANRTTASKHVQHAWERIHGAFGLIRDHTFVTFVVLSSVMALKDYLHV